jgi:hypothetical protein
MINKQKILFQVKFIFIGFLICGFIGAFLGIFKVILFEQSSSGQFATRKECSYWDKECVAECEAAYDYPDNAPSCDCCLRYDNVTIPLGKRINQVAMHYGITAGAIGFGAGLIYGNGEWEKKTKQ